MRLELDRIAEFKNYIHAFQGGLLALAFFLSIAIFTRDGHTDGRVGWYFGLCWLTIIVLVYLVMVPMWSRARRFSNVYAFATLDAGSVFLWLTAWASTASYVADGKGSGDNKDATGCDNFKYGSPGRCKLSEGITFIGVIIMLAFLVTSLASFRAVMHYKRTGLMPMNTSKNNDFSAQTQAAFSSNMHNDPFDDDNVVDARHGGYGYTKPSFDEDYAPIHQNDNEDIGQMQPIHTSGPLNREGLGLHDYDTSYTGAGANHSPMRDPTFEHGYRYERQN